MMPIVNEDRLSPQAFVVSGVAAWVVVNPYFGLRYGGVLALLTALTMFSSFKLRRTDLLLLGYASLALVSYWWADFPETTWENAKDQATVACLAIGIRVVGAASARNLRVITTGYLAACVYSVWRLWDVRDELLTSTSDDYVRASLEGVNANYTAYALVTGAALAILLSRSARRPRLWLLMAVLGLFALGVSFTGTRGAFVGAAALLAWWIVHRYRPLLLLRGLVFGGAMLVVLVATGWVDELLRPDEQTARETGDLNGRLPIWYYARTAMAARPLVGHGAGAFYEINPLSVVAHNAVLEVGVGLGVVGVVTFGVVLYSVLIQDTRAIPDNRSRALVVGGLAAVMLPIYASGHWDQSPAAWTALAVISCAGVLFARAGRGVDGVLGLDVSGPRSADRTTARTFGVSR